MDPGLGKTSIVLEAFRRLQEQEVAEHMLVVAPLRVCQLVWRQEAQKWSQFRHFRFSFLHGPHKRDRLRDDADIWLINPEGVPWLSDMYYGRALPWDTVVIDEITRFKNHRAKRAKALRPRLRNVRRRWGLTGTPIPNGYMDLFGQMLMLDDGQALGRYITHFRDKYFEQDWNGFDYTLHPGADKRIEERIKPYVLRMGSDDYLELPPLLTDTREVDMASKARKTYESMKREMLAEFEEGVVTAANAAAAYSKLKQMANGTVYLEDVPGEKRQTVWLHNDKIDALDELIEELAGQPLLVAYEFRHDLERLLEHFGRETPYLGSGVTYKKADEITSAWNNGDVSLLLVHPASAGHGLNMQGAGAGHIAWFSATWDYELYDQLIRRIWRQGSSAERIINHIFVMRNTVDELVMQALKTKDTTQERLLAALNAEVLRESNPKSAREYAAAVETKDQEDTEMVKKLSRKSSSKSRSREEETEEEEERPRPKGWGAPASDDDDEEEEKPRKKPKGWGAPASADDEEEEEPAPKKRSQREEMSSKLKGEEDEEEEEEPASSKSKRMFSEGVRNKLEENEDAEEAEEEPAPAKPAKAKAKKKEPAETESDDPIIDALIANLEATVQLLKRVRK